VSESAVDLPVAPSPEPDGPVPAPARSGALGAAVGIPLSVVSGACLALALPGTGWWPLAPVGVAGLTLAVRGARSRYALLLGLLAGLGCFVPALHWSGVYVGALPWLALATLEALFVALMAVLLPWAWRAPGGWAGTALIVAGLWVAQEAARGRLPFGGFPWARLAFSQADAPTLGLAALGGAPLVSAAVALSGGLLAVAVAALAGARAGERGTASAALADRSRVRRHRLTALLALPAAVGVVLSGWAVPGIGRTSNGSGPDTLRVAAVQGNVPAPGLDFNAERRAVLDNHARLTTDLAARVAAGTAPRPDVVFWPENASDVDPLRNSDAAAVIDAAVRAIGVPVVVGAVLESPPNHVLNASIVWTPQGGPGTAPDQQYYKQHPAPFGEYIPYRSFFRRFSDKVDLVTRDFLAGHRVGVMTAGDLRFGDVICFEVAYDGLVRDTVRGGARLLVVQTNNATFGYTDESTQQLAMSRLRAVESGRSVVHISTVGVSALIEPDGTLRQPTRLFTSALLAGDVRLSDRTTVANRVGGWPEAVLAGLGLVLALAGGRRLRADRRRDGRAVPDETAR
jgi:apolipoprotein N-acyltransferase